jgi:MoxR-like ATPase
LIVGVCIFGSFFFMLVVDYMQKTAGIEQKQYDIATITAGDYTVEYEIKESLWNRFKRQQKDIPASDEYDEVLLLRLKKLLMEQVKECV